MIVQDLTRLKPGYRIKPSVNRFTGRLCELYTGGSGSDDWVLKDLTQPQRQHVLDGPQNTSVLPLLLSMSVCAGRPGPDDWVLEDLKHDGCLYLMDPKTSKLFTVPSGSGAYPRPVGE